MEAFGTLAGGLAHGFNNALTVIIGNIALAKLYAKPGEKVLERLEEAERASLKARDLTNQLMPFSDENAPVWTCTCSIAEGMTVVASVEKKGSPESTPSTR